MCGIFPGIYHQLHVGKYTLHGSYMGFNKAKGHPIDPERKHLVKFSRLKPRRFPPNGGEK